jgi:SAM-dependent methyltransferase
MIFRQIKPMTKAIKPIHPFPARMAAEFVLKELSNSPPRMRVLDPMAGSGTTLVAAKMHGHEAIGFDRDPLAVLIASAWASDVDVAATLKKAEQVLIRAKERAGKIGHRDAYPRGASTETREFVRYWFDTGNRKQLAALADSISHTHDEQIKRLLWCAFSKLIITKQSGVSLAIDISHSRPHKFYTTAPIKALDHFARAVLQITKAAPFTDSQHCLPEARVQNADARKLPLPADSVDIVMTSPPYLNAIDYVRGHKLSLVWMGYDVRELRVLRSTNVGAEISAAAAHADEATETIMREMCDGNELTSRSQGMLRRYVRDLREVVSESFRVLRPGGKAIYVMGNCNLRDTFIENSKCLTILAKESGFIVCSSRKRPLAENRRYLPPPGKRGSGHALRKRMREEVILTLVKP